MKTLEEKNTTYDNEIAPALLEIMKKCQEAEIPFIAAAFIDPETFGETAFIPNDCNNAHVRTVQAAVKAKGNADVLIWAMMRHGEKHGHNSACLSILERLGK
jgi:hypothetical protein